MVDSYDVLIVGGGIVGLGTALALTARRPNLRVAVVEKGSAVGTHQTGHNSGVIHSGIYYKPGSLKARLCVDGGRRMAAFCDEHGIPYERCGKLVLATDQRELPALAELHRRGTANGVPGLRRMSPAEYREVEPNAAGIAALHVPGTGIVDYRQVAAAMARVLAGRGVAILLGREVTAVAEVSGGSRVVTSAGELSARALINCAGLHSDRIARLMGVQPDVQIVPFRGEYFFLRQDRANLVKGLIYPVPDPALPFLGVHLTRTIHGGVEAGPNAVLALAREGYTRGSVNWQELRGTLGYSGFRTLARRYWRTGLFEYYRSFSKAAFARSLAKLVPDIRMADLSAGGAGVRAQAVTAGGQLVDDFRIVAGARAIHVLNAPSPAATASLAIGDHVAHLAEEAFALA
jgi:(S)-2-hydroxyglutarate dehydrogenase